MYGYIYKTTNLINGKIYVGQHKSKEFDKSYYGSGKILKNAILKEGLENFICEILAEADTKEQLDELEKYYIKLYDVQNPEIGYNIAEGGNDGNKDLNWFNNGIEECVSTKDKLDDSWYSGRLPMSEEQKNKLRGKLFTNQHKKAIANSKKGLIYITNGKIDKQVTMDELPIYLEQGFWRGRSLGIPQKGYKHSPETIMKMKEKRALRPPMSEEIKQKISNTIKKTESDPYWKEKHSKKMLEVNGTRGSKWYNNGLKEKHFKNNDEIPEGWILGRLPMTDEQKQKLHLAFTGRSVSDETRQKMSKAQKGKNTGRTPGNAVKIICLTTGEIFNSYTEVTEKTGISFSTIKKSIENKCLVGKNKYAKEKFLFDIWED